MEKESSIKLFEDKNIRVAWNDTEEKWYFSVVDIVAVLTENDYQAGRKYWKTLKMRLNKEGSELVTKCYQLKMIAYDGKLRDTDVMSTEQILRLVQSIPSKKAEPFKLWLAQVGRERIDETYDPEIAINRALDTSSTEISKGVNPQGFDATKGTVIKGANVAKMAREQIEKESGKKIVSSKNARDKKALDINSGKENSIKNKGDFIKIGEGATSKAYKYDNNYVLLAGKRDDSFEIYKKLKKNLDLLEGKINSIRIPSKANVIKPCKEYPLGAMTYLYVEGNELKNRVHTCTEEQKRDIGKKLAEFIFEIQNININLDKSKEIEINNNKLKNAIEIIKAYLSNEENIKLEKVAINYNDFMIDSNFCMTHGDLQEENLIVDKNNNLIGIIDFGNMEYYVPEIEFDSMMNYDLSIFEAMIKNFKGKIEINNIRLVGLVRRVRFFKHIVNKNYDYVLKEVEEIKILLSKYKI